MNGWAIKSKMLVVIKKKRLFFVSKQFTRFGKSQFQKYDERTTSSQSVEKMQTVAPFLLKSAVCGKKKHPLYPNA